MPGKGETKEQIRTKINIETSASIVPIELFRQIFSTTTTVRTWLCLILTDTCLSSSVRGTTSLKHLPSGRKLCSMQR